MILPESERSRAIAKAKELLEDPATTILFVSQNGIVLTNNGDTLSITEYLVEFVGEAE